MKIKRTLPSLWAGFGLAMLAFYVFGYEPNTQLFLGLFLGSLVASMELE